jgi:cytochrome c-type biogenesis protein CcmH/NrfF
MYRMRMPFKQIDTVLWAKPIALVFLDIQVAQVPLKQVTELVNTFLALSSFRHDPESTTFRY